MPEPTTNSVDETYVGDLISSMHVDDSYEGWEEEWEEDGERESKSKESMLALKLFFYDPCKLESICLYFDDPRKTRAMESREIRVDVPDPIYQHGTYQRIGSVLQFMVWNEISKVTKSKLMENGSVGGAQELREILKSVGYDIKKLRQE
ncbi:hypothetical protein OAU50_08545 [Planctomycetota bacterium]|nr:hypothetical protein [Planctomycetota bacterium]